MTANWQGNPITVKWYNGDTEYDSNQCTYGGDLTMPSSIPQKTGYTFKGWRVRVPVCSFTASEVNGMSGVNYGYKSDSTGAYGAVEENAFRYGLTTDNSWAVEFKTGIIKGMAKCSSTNGDSGTPSDTDGSFCWCQATNYTPNWGNQCNVASPSWVFNYNDWSASDCAVNCANDCANVVMIAAGFRRAVFGVQ